MGYVKTLSAGLCNGNQSVNVSGRTLRALVRPTLNIWLLVNQLTIYEVQHLRVGSQQSFILHMLLHMNYLHQLLKSLKFELGNKKILRIQDSDCFYIKEYWRVNVLEIIANFIYHRICRFSKLKEEKERFISFLLQGFMVQQNFSVILCSGILPFLLIGLIPKDSLHSFPHEVFSKLVRKQLFPHTPLQSAWEERARLGLEFRLSSFYSLCVTAFQP